MIPEPFATFEQLVAQLISIDPKLDREKWDKAVDDLLVFFVGVVSQGVSAETKLASLESENASLRERTRWIPVSERLPEDETWVLIWEEGNGVGIAKHILHMPLWTTSDGYNIRDRNYSRVTHWMPLPEAPKEDE